MVNTNKLLQEYKIFIATPAFNEQYVFETISSALEKAEYPDRISFGIWEHSTTGKFTDTSMFDCVKHVKLSYGTMLGIGVARLGAFTLYDNEDFILQVDAHTLFADKWDTTLINWYLKILNETQHNKIIISSVGAWWKPQISTTDDSNVYLSWPQEEKKILVMSHKMKRGLDKVDEAVLMSHYHNDNPAFYFLGYAQKKDNTYLALHRLEKPVLQSFNTIEEMEQWFSIGYQDAGGYPKQEGYVVESTTGFAEHYTFAANFMFTDPSFIKEVMPDPFIMFGGEEPTTALRAWTRDYRIFAIEDTVLWHLNKNGIEFVDDRMFNPGLPHLLSHYHAKEQDGLNRVKEILTGQITGYWGALNTAAHKIYELNSDFSFSEFYSNIGNYFWKQSETK